MASATPEVLATLVVQDATDGSDLAVTWTVSCRADATDPEGAAIAPTSVIRTLRYSATSEVIVSWESPDLGLTDVARAIAGTRVEAELVAGCVVNGISGEPVTVVTAPVVVAPVLQAPLTASLVDGSLVAVTELPVGAAFTLVDVVLLVLPKGTEVATVWLQGAGTDFTRELTAADIDPATRSVRLSPTVTSDQAGELVLSASFMGVDAVPVTLRVGGAPSEGEGEGEGEGDPPGPNCTASGPSGSGSAMASLLLLLLRMRRHRRGRT